MPADRIWNLYPNGPGDGVEQVWVEARGESGLAVAPRLRTIGTGQTVYPLSTRVIRLRWREGITVRTVFVDPDDNTWNVDGWREVGRRQWLDVQVSTFQDATTGDDVTDPVAPAEFTAPAGWILQDGDGNAVQQVTISAFEHDFFGFLSGFRVGVPEGGFQLDGAWDAGMLRWPATVNGAQTILVASGALASLGQALAAGDNWPDFGARLGFSNALVDGTFTAGRVSVGLSTLTVGDIITIEDAS